MTAFVLLIGSNINRFNSLLLRKIKCCQRATSASFLNVCHKELGVFNHPLISFCYRAFGVCFAFQWVIYLVVIILIVFVVLHMIGLNENKRAISMPERILNSLYYRCDKDIEITYDEKTEKIYINLLVHHWVIHFRDIMDFRKRKVSLQ